MPRPERWSELVPLIPAELRPYLLGIEWDRELLWSLELPVERLAVAELTWHLDMPMWRLDGKPFALRPREVLAEPHRFASHYARTLNADLRHPLSVTRRHGRWMILDGVHRLAKAVLLELSGVAVRKVPGAALERIAA